jgi:hypothetical protein
MCLGKRIPNQALSIQSLILNLLINNNNGKVLSCESKIVITKTRKNILMTVSNCIVFTAYLVIVLCFACGANLDVSNQNPLSLTSFMSGYDTAEIVLLFLLLLNNSFVIYVEKTIVILVY